LLKGVSQYVLDVLHRLSGDAELALHQLLDRT
jgi:hypothetical protein